MIEIRMHGRGGQGVVTSSKILGLAASIEGIYSQALPFYGFERRGAPVEVYLRLGDKPILISSQIYEPDGIVVLDPILAEMNVVARGLKTGGFAVLNTLKPPEQIDYTKRLSRVGVVDATGVALKTLKVPISNTAILGAFIKTVGMLKLSSVEEAIRQVLPERLHAANIEALRLAYEETRVREA
ncbi:MAG: 2-oxoacid:acceptor oxidoreductase family protein [Candidatus Bathyarchaeia archaeon]|nr:2-oxoacid:acceptor oxidoreductase family protein [Candidatus Bathyarchaeota archaeon]